MLIQTIFNEASKDEANWQALAKKITEGSDYYKKKLCSKKEHDTIDVVELIQEFISKHGDFLNGRPEHRSDRTD